MKEYIRIFWFMFGLITSAINYKYGWWGLVTIPIWFTLEFLIVRLWEWKPKQRTLNDYKTQ